MNEIIIKFESDDLYNKFIELLTKELENAKNFVGQEAIVKELTTEENKTNVLIGKP